MNYLENHLYRNLIDLIGSLNGKNLCVALSMGADSTALFYSLLAVQKALEKQKMIFSVCACHLNHMLRSQSKKEEESFVSIMKSLKIPNIVRKDDVFSYSKENKISIESSARKIRYTFFSEVKKSLNADYILTAHHKDDMVETMLFNFFRGTGLQGLRSIPTKRDYIIRPFLDILKEDCIAYLKEKSIIWYEDKSNNDILYSRNYIRHEIIPKIVSKFPGFYSSIESLHDILLQQDLYFTQKYQGIIKKNIWKRKWFEQQHLYIQRELLYKKLSLFLPYKPFSFAFINEIINRLKRMRNNGEICNLNHISIYSTYGKLYFLKNNIKNDEGFCFDLVKTPMVKIWNGYKISINKSKRPVTKKNAKNILYIAIKNKYDTICIDSYNPGDYIMYAYGKSKKIHDVFIDLKVPKFLRKHIPLIKIVDTNYLHDKKIAGLYIPKEYSSINKNDRSIIVDPDYFVDFKAEKDYIKIKIIRIKDEQF